MQKITSFVLISFFLGCATSGPLKSARPTVVSDASLVANCKFIGEFEGRSGFAGMMIEHGKASSLGEALQNAQDYGVNTALYHEAYSTTDFWGVRSTVKGYFCKNLKKANAVINNNIEIKNNNQSREVASP